MKTKTSDPVFVFSLLHAESLDCLQLCIDNFRMFAQPGDKLIINSSVRHGYEHPSPAPDVLIVEGKPRKAHGADLLAAHLDNWRTAQARWGQQEFLFITLASNALFFRSYDKLSVIASMKVAQTKPLATQTGWQYEAIRKSPSFIQAFGEQYIHNQIEGFATWSTSWSAIERKFKALDYGAHRLEQEVCLEEVLPLAALAIEQLASTNICQMKWADSRKGRRFVTPHDLLVQGKQQPFHICLYKWFDRNPRSLASRLVSDQALHDQFKAFFDLAPQWGEDPAERLDLARAILDPLKLPDTVIDLGRHSFSANIDKSCDRKVIRLNEGLSRSPFLYMETLPPDFQARIQISIANGRVVIHSESPSLGLKVNPTLYYDLKFYVVLYLPIPESVTHLYLTHFERPRADDPSQFEPFDTREMVMNLAVLEHQGRYEVLQARASAFESDFLAPFALYDLQKTARAGVRCFGVPVIPNTRLAFELRSG